MKKIFSNKIVSVASSVLVSVMAVALVGYAASTISTNITTDGTMRVTGTFTAKGTADFDSTAATTTISGGLRADTSDNTLVVDFSSSRVGIGTTSPSVLFSVGGTSILGGPVTMFGPSSAMGTFTIGNLVSTSTAATSTLEWGLAIETSGFLYAADTNRVGVGTTSPGSLLSVQAGNAQITGTTTTSALVATSTLFVGNIGQNFNVNEAGRIGVGTTTPGSLLSVQAGNTQITGTTTTSALHATSTVFVGATGNLFLVNAAGSVGVATTSPGNLFSVSGSSLLGSADADIVSLRAGDVRFNSNATTTITTKNLRGVNVNSGDLVLDTESNSLYVGTSTPLRGTLGIDGTATTTIAIGTTAAATGACFEFPNALNGATMRMYATSSDAGYARLELGSCY